MQETSGGASRSESESASPVETCEKILSNKSIEGRRADFMNFVRTLGPEMMPAIMAALEKAEKSGKDVGFERDAVLQRWGALNPVAALTYLDGIKDKTLRYESYDKLFRGWAKNDPNAAKAWLAQNAENGNFDAAFLGFVSGRGVASRNDATDMILQNLAIDDPLLPEALSRMAAVARDDSINAMKAWYNNLPSDQPDSLRLKTLAAAALYKQLPQRELMPVARWIEELAKQPWRNNRIINQFAYDFSAREPKNAMNWIQGTTPMPEKGVYVGVGAVVENFRRKNLPGLEQWLNEHPNSPIYHQAAHDLALLLRNSDRKKAEYWAAKVNHPLWGPQVQKEMARK